MRTILSVAALAAVLGAGGAHAATQTFQFTGPHMPANYAALYDPTIANGQFLGLAGLEWNDTSLLLLPNAPDGKISAFIQTPTTGSNYGDLYITFNNLAKGDLLSLSFYAGSGPEDTPNLWVTEDGRDPSSVIVVGDWTQYTLAFTANGSSATFGFATEALRGSVVAIDDIELTSTAPEPSTWALMLAGFAGLGFAGRRRGKAALARA